MLDAHSAAGDVDRASKGKINETGLSGDSSSVVSDSDQRDCVCRMQCVSTNRRLATHQCFSGNCYVHGDDRPGDNGALYFGSDHRPCVTRYLGLALLGALGCCHGCEMSSCNRPIDTTKDPPSLSARGVSLGSSSQQSMAKCLAAETLIC